MVIKKIFFIVLIFLFFAGSVKAASVGENIKFNIDKNYDISGRSETEAVLIKISSQIYFYADKNWWGSLSFPRQAEISGILDSLNWEFENKIYPDIASVFGTEWKPGVDGDSIITVLFHSMREGAGGYFRSVDEYLKQQYPESNEREMFYIETGQLDNLRQMKNLMTHELTHLITFNQKDKKFNVSEETWLNESRAEYAITLLGYNDSYEGSNLQNRVKAFVDNPGDSLTEWQNRKSDYGVINVFIQYLVDHYGVQILIDSLKTNLTGIPSINEALKKNGFSEDFTQIFTDWAIATLINNCSFGQKYCFLNKNLANLKIYPLLNFLPLTGRSSLSVTNLTKNWSGNWQKVIGGKGYLKLEFNSLTGLNFKVPYLVFQDGDKGYSLKFLNLDKNQSGTISIADFGSKVKSLVIIPILESKLTGFNGNEPTYPYTFSISLEENPANNITERIKDLRDKIQQLQNEIKKTQEELDNILSQQGSVCQGFYTNLFAGSSGKEDIICLQTFLKEQDQIIYPEGLVTGYFGPLTRAAVIRFQEKYASEILAPLGLNKGTGFVGEKTRDKINRLMGY